MKRCSAIINCFWGFLALCVFLVRPVVSDCLNSFDPNVDYFPDKIDSQGSGFIVTYHNSYKLVTNTRGGEQYVLHCTVAPPNISNPSKFFQVPVKNVASLDQDTLTFLEIIGAQSSLRYVKEKGSITSPCLQKDTTIQSFDNSSFTNIDVLFTDGEEKDSDKSVIVSLSDNQSPLMKAEWVKFISLFFNLETSANEFYSNIKAAYSCNAANLENISARKTIAWVAYDFDSGKFTVDTANYYLSLVKDAGANSPNVINSSLELNDLHEAINNVNIIIDQTKFPTGNDTFDTWQRLFGYYTTSTSSLPEFVTYRRIFRPKKLLNANGFDDWTERASARPDLAILDLIAIQYPTYLTSYQTTWLENFAESDEPTVITSADCTDGAESRTVLTCQPQNFAGDQTNKNDKPTVNTDGDSKLKPRSIVIIVFSILAGLMGVAGGIWLLLFARKRYEERFLELKDEPEVRMEKVDEEKNEASGGEVENKV